MSCAAGRLQLELLQETIPMSEEALSPAELKARIEELQTLLTQKISELEENAEWGTPEEREELAQALDDLGVQVEALSDALQVIED
jgi:hypothetical protein